MHATMALTSGQSSQHEGGAASGVGSGRLSPHALINATTIATRNMASIVPPNELAEVANRG